MAKHKVKQGSRSKADRLRSQLKNIPKEVEDYELVREYLHESVIITIDFMQRFGNGEHRFFKEFRKNLEADPEWMPDVMDIMRVLAACAHYAESYGGNSGTPEKRRKAMVDRLMKDDMPDSLADPPDD